MNIEVILEKLYLLDQEERQSHRESCGRGNGCLRIRRLETLLSFASAEWGKDGAWLKVQGWCGRPRETNQVKSTDGAGQMNTCVRTDGGSKARMIGKMAWNPSLKFKWRIVPLLCVCLEFSALGKRKSKRTIRVLLPSPPDFRYLYVL